MVMTTCSIGVALSSAGAQCLGGRRGDSWASQYWKSGVRFTQYLWEEFNYKVYSVLSQVSEES